MENSVLEAQYDIRFREEDSLKLGQHLKSHHSVVLIGMKRVGISNFLRFFLYHKDVSKTYIDSEKEYLFIPVDLNDLIEREVFAFWRLTLKRIVDRIATSSLPAESKQYIQNAFSSSIQSQDLFLTIDSVRQALVKLVENNIFPVLFFIRFDRMKDVITPEFFDNIQGLKDATHQKVSYVFTGFRGLNKLAPEVFTKTSLSVFADNMYIKPANKEDIITIFETYMQRYKLTLPEKTHQALFDLVDGYVQYLQLALICLREGKEMPQTKEELFEKLVKDERISLQSEELWESLSGEEQEILIKVSKKVEITEEDREKGKYLWNTGFITEENNSLSLFSPLFDFSLQERWKKTVPQVQGDEFSKKEHALFKVLQDHIGEICEREEIVKSVWPETEAFGVSDWAIDRLVARVRNKMKLKKAKFEIQTVKTRGYKLVPLSE